MWFQMKTKIVLVLLFLSFLCVPVYGQTVDGDGQSEPVGQTAVVARVEMPEPTDGSSNEGTETEQVETGDETPIELYAALLLSSGIAAGCYRKWTLHKSKTEK